MRSFCFIKKVMVAFSIVISALSPSLSAQVPLEEIKEFFSEAYINEDTLGYCLSLYDDQWKSFQEILSPLSPEYRQEMGEMLVQNEEDPVEFHTILKDPLTNKKITESESTYRSIMIALICKKEDRKEFAGVITSDRKSTRLNSSH